MVFSFNFFKSSFRDAKCKICRNCCLNNRGSCFGGDQNSKTINVIYLQRSKTQIKLCDGCLASMNKIDSFIDIILKEKGVI